MYTEQYHGEYDPEITDEVFDELFEDNYEESYPEYTEAYPDYVDAPENYQDNLYLDDHTGETVESLLEGLSYEIEGMTPDQAYEHISEAWPALIPIVKAVAPMVISAATQLAPMAIKAAGGLFKGKGRRPAHVARPQTRTPHPPRPRPSRPYYPPRPAFRPKYGCRCQQPTPSRLSGFGQGALSSLSNLLSNPKVQGILSGLANKGISQALKLGNSESYAREGALLNAIEYLAREAQVEALDDHYDDSMDYLIGPDGHYEVDIDSPESRAERFIELFEN